MKRFLYLFFFCCFLIFPTPAYAHIFASDGSIEALLHIPPDDKPLANEHTRMKFQFNDDKKQFNLDSCQCILEVYRQKKKIFIATLKEQEISYTFPEKDIYRIIVTGKPTVQNSFQPFTLTYDVRVEKDATDLATEKKQSTERFSLFLLAAGMVSSIMIPLFISLA